MTARRRAQPVRHHLQVGDAEQVVEGLCSRQFAQLQEFLQSVENVVVDIGASNVEELLKLTEQISRDFPNSVFFASKLIFVHDNLFTRWLHNQTALAMQQRLHLQGMQMVILPMKVE